MEERRQILLGQKAILNVFERMGAMPGQLISVADLQVAYDRFVHRELSRQELATLFPGIGQKAKTGKVLARFMPNLRVMANGKSFNMSLLRPASEVIAELQAELDLGHGGQDVVAREANRARGQQAADWDNFFGQAAIEEAAVGELEGQVLQPRGAMEADAEELVGELVGVQPEGQAAIEEAAVGELEGQVLQPRGAMEADAEELVGELGGVQPEGQAAIEAAVGELGQLVLYEDPKKENEQEAIAAEDQDSEGSVLSVVNVNTAPKKNKPGLVVIRRVENIRRVEEVIVVQADSEEDKDESGAGTSQQLVGRSQSVGRALLRKMK